MAKTAKPKANAASKSVRSRAAKRAASPTLNLDKSLTNLPRPEPTHRPAILSAQHNAGISKKSKSKQMTRAQKKRQEKGLERAEIVMDKTETKVAKSMGRGRVVKARSAPWEELNEKALAAQTKHLSRDDADIDDAMDEDEQKQTSSRPATKSSKSSAPPQKPVSDQKFEFEEDGEIT
ncbi:hypothetical protein FQN50_007726 [Emmonsiellopsis sp. PD_5]|nr:hypothetical protein FQN50_007726 [Emmonsiellopsis sp. PD_5]